MSVRSWGYYEMSWPKDTPFDKTWLYHDEPEDLGDRLHMWYDFCDVYAYNLLDCEIKMFGKPLDKVQGLELHLEYVCYEDGYFEFRIDIVDGKVRYEESEIIFNERPLSECPVGLG